ncbi:MarR family EPS-associated transcriptional regulator [Pararhodobacter oceanensis]|uniref:MarR family EPS-associated transcriptional regulator n=1 Tax=Pararhodobacter oceanensis TaxID=2172121 RepID=A0A2T8HS89_9RHOB|nr:MarR family EPS-associated transcriptional regulator [Pararhodobacter oceanensis]PVH28243.1 MarR family EPS-associated transcriptional regulator [Pararhodobacter oceanensis]
MSQRSKIRDDARFRALRLLHKNPEMSQRELARDIGISAGAVHYVLNALFDKGLVEFRKFTAAEDKRRYAYILTTEGLAQKTALTQSFLTRKREEYEALKEEIKALQSDIDREQAARE